MKDGGKSDKPVVPRKDANNGGGNPPRRNAWREGAWPREIRESKAGFGLRANSTCDARWTGYAGPQCACVTTRGRSPVR